MDDKWNSYVEGQRLFLHRSWTGHGIYEAQFRADAEEWRITEAVVTNDNNVYRRESDDYESLSLEALIEGVLLQRWTKDYGVRLAALRPPASPLV
jgi:hypothetical protein